MVICVVGDSIASHYHPYLQAYLKGIANYGGQDGEAGGVMNFDDPPGLDGRDSSAVLAWLKEKARGGGIKADLLLLNCGLHDIKTDPHTHAKQIPIKQYESNLRAIVQTVADMRPKLVWVRTTPCDETVHNRTGMSFYRFSADCAIYNQAADEIMRDGGVPAIDLHTFTVNLGPDLYCDHVHFHDHIREKQAAFIAGWLIAFTEHGIAQPSLSGGA